MEGIKKIDQYNSVKVDKYNGRYSLVLGNESEDGNRFYASWRFLSQWDKEQGKGVPREKEDGSLFQLPTSIVLGESEEEVKATLEWVYKEVQKMNAPAPESEDVPF